MTTNSIHKIIRNLSIIALLSSTPLLTGCDDAEASVDNADKPEEIIKVPVESSNIVISDIASYYSANAVLEAVEETDVISKVQGLIESIKVEEGDYVKKGQVLAVIESDRYQLIYQQTKAELAQVKSQLDRLNAVNGKHLVSVEQLDKLQWQYESLKAKAALTELDLKHTQITAPISGHIASRNVKKGNLVNGYQQQEMFHIVDQNQLEGILYLPESQLNKIQIGQKVLVNIPSTSQKVFQANVLRIGTTVNSDNGTFKVVVLMDNKQQLLKPGMFANVEIELGLHKNALLAPSSSLITLDDKHFVYQIVDGKAVKTLVEIGYRNSGQVEIVSGLDASAELITAGHSNLKDQTAVNVIASTL